MLWWKLRKRESKVGDLTRSQLAIWGAATLVLVIQGAAGPQMPYVVYAASATFMVTYAMANLLSKIAQIQFRPRLYLGLLALGILGSLIGLQLELPFALVTLPTLLGTSFPLFATSYTIIRTRWKQFSISAKGLVLSALFYGAHILDFAVLADVAAAGFTIAILSIFALSIFVPAVVVETITVAHARTEVEMEAARRIQLDLLPKEPDIPGLEITCYMKPAEEVGGDYYDIYTFGDRAWIMLGDVSDLGLSSGLVMLMAQSIISSIL
ncbi:MAG: hypothetical protein AAGC55_13980, partial [Myxococcota bacterium]